MGCVCLWHAKDLCMSLINSLGCNILPQCLSQYHSAPTIFSTPPPTQNIQPSSLTRLTAGLQCAPTAFSHSSSCTPRPGYSGCEVTGDDQRTWPLFPNTSSPVSGTCEDSRSESTDTGSEKYPDASGLVDFPWHQDRIGSRWHIDVWHDINCLLIESERPRRDIVKLKGKGIFQMRCVDG